MAARRVVPILLVTVVLAVTGAAAGVALSGASSAPQVALQDAAQATLAAPTFVFDELVITPSLPVPAAEGVYRAPDHLVVWPDADPHAVVVPTHGATGSSFVRSAMDGSLLPRVPPLASVVTADEVTRQGDHFAFVIPSLNRPDVLSPFFTPRSALSVPDTPATAVVRGGRVVQLSLPSGIPGEVPPTTWTFSAFEETATQPPLPPAPCPAHASVPSMATGSYCGPTPPAGNGLGPEGQCTGLEAFPPCGPGVVVGRDYAYTLPGACNGLIDFDGRQWVSELPPPTPVPDFDVWMRLTPTGVLGFISPRGAVGFMPYDGQALASCNS